MIRSFRLRLVLGQMLLTGLALAVFAFAALALIKNAKLERIDAALRLAVEREATRPPGARPRLDDRLAASLGLADSERLAVLVLTQDGEVLHRSRTWPTGLSSERLPWPAGDTAASSGLFIASALAAPAPPHRLQGPPPHPPEGLPPPPQGTRLPMPPHERPPAPHEQAPPAPTAISGATATPPATTEMPTSSPAANAPAPATESAAVPAAEPERGFDARRPPRPPRTLLVDHVSDGAHWRLALAHGSQLQALIGVDLAVIDAEMRPLRNAFLLALPVALAVLGIGAWLLSSRALAPLQRLTQATRGITLDGLDQRIPSAGDDEEFATLIEVYNRMLARLQRSYAQARRFSADAAHELRTPLAIMQGQLERAIAAAPTGSPLQVDLSLILDEVRRLSGISRKLLLLAQADAGHMRLRREPFALGEFLVALADDAHMLGPDLALSTRIDAALHVEADPALLKQALHNLIGNAVKYNLPGGWLRIEGERSGNEAVVRIANASAGVSREARERVFERFFRGDAAHGNAVEGSGLGLALSREIARAHGGELSFRADDDGRVELTLVLPLHHSAGSKA